jgi:hypothetical protein
VFLYSRSSDPLTGLLILKMDTVGFFEMFVTVQHLTRHNISEDLDVHQNRCENLKSRNVALYFLLGSFEGDFLCKFLRSKMVGGNAIFRGTYVVLDRIKN